LTSLFCRHNRFTADCPICSKGSVLSSEHAEGRQPAPKRPPKPSQAGGNRARSATRGAAARAFTGPYVSGGPFDRDGRQYEVRLEKVPGGLRLAEWRGGALERHAPVLPASALREMVDEAAGRSLLRFSLPEAEAAQAKGTATSSGKAGDMREELRIERVPEPGLVRIGRWVYWPGEDAWELQESPVMLPEPRFEEALSAAARAGLL